MTTEKRGEVSPLAATAADLDSGMYLGTTTTQHIGRILTYK